MRGVRDLVLVAAVAAVATALSAIGTGISVAERESHAADADIAAGVTPVRVGSEEGDGDQPQTRPRMASPAGGTARGRRRSLPEPHPMRIGAPWREGPITEAAPPRANDLRAFLANMASADRDGHAIGIARQDAVVLWVDDAAK